MTHLLKIEFVYKVRRSCHEYLFLKISIEKGIINIKLMKTQSLWNCQCDLDSNSWKFDNRTICFIKIYPLNLRESSATNHAFFLSIKPSAFFWFYKPINMRQCWCSLEGQQASMYCCAQVHGPLIHGVNLIRWCSHLIKSFGFRHVINSCQFKTS